MPTAITTSSTSAQGYVADPRNDDVLVYVNGALSQLLSTDTSTGIGGVDPMVGNDTIEGNGGNDIVIAGVGSDDVSGGLGDDIILGDEGQLDWNLTSDTVRGRSDVVTVTLDGVIGTLDRVTTTDIT